MRLFSVLIFCLLSLVGSAQTAKNKIPPFKILQTDGRFFTPEGLSKKKPVVLIYFAPDCAHCETLMQSFFKKITAFQDAEVVMITFKPLEELRKFVLDRQIGKYKNIIAGTEGTTFFIRYFYSLTNTPFVALFDKEGNLLHSYRHITSVDDLIGKVKSVK